MVIEPQHEKRERSKGKKVPVLKISLVRDPHFPCPTKDAAAIDFPVGFAHPRPALVPRCQRLVPGGDDVPGLRFSDVVKEGVPYFRCEGGFPRRCSTSRYAQVGDIYSDAVE